MISNCSSKYKNLKLKKREKKKRTSVALKSNIQSIQIDVGP
jgi:hypothetical protein